MSIYRYALAYLLCVALCTISTLGYASDYTVAGFKKNPYDYLVAAQLSTLRSTTASDRAVALASLSVMRAFGHVPKVVPLLKDPSADVRREAAMNLGWTGDKSCLPALVGSLSDEDWTVRQAAVLALQNLTAKTLEFDALAPADVRRQRAKAWEDAVKTFKAESLVNDLMSAPVADNFRRADVIRAIGFMKVASAEALIVSLLKPYLKKQVDSRQRESTIQATRPEKHFVQACIRTLGRIGGDESRTLLIQLLDAAQWAPYAADALGDIGGDTVAAALISHYPDYAFQINRRDKKHGHDYKGLVKKVHRSDRPGLLPDDRIPRVAHMILQSLCRISFKAPKTIESLKGILPNVFATMPTMFDATVVYELEPHQMFAGYLAEKCGLRQTAVDIAFQVLKVGGRQVDSTQAYYNDLLAVIDDNAGSTKSRDMPYAGTILMACCRDKKDVPLLIELLGHPNGWIKIDAARTLLYMEAVEAVPQLMKLLAAAKDDADYGYDMDFRRFGSNNKSRRVERKMPGAGYDEYNDPSPRHKEAFIMALGGLRTKAAVPLLTTYLNNQRNVAEIQYAAARALSQIATPEALEALRLAEARHPFESVKLVAREAVWRHALNKAKEPSAPKTRTVAQLPVPEGKPREIVFIKGIMNMGNHEQFSSDLTGYSTTDGGPTYRQGNNVFRCTTADPKGSLTQLTAFKDGAVADLEVSYDGKRILFAHRGPGVGKDADPWWHVYEMNADGTGLRQLTKGPYHDVQPNYMPDGRIVFSTTRLGMRDEYHGYPATGLAVMNDDGSDIHMIGFSLGRDAEPVVADDGKILFSRLELFYSRLKTEWNLLTVFPDGTHAATLYGPERRGFWRGIGGAGSIAPPRHRVLRITQPQYWGGSQYLINSFRGPMLVGPGHLKERVLRKDNTWAVTTPYKIDENTLLVAAGKRPASSSKRVNVMAPVDHGIHYMDMTTGELTVIYNDPKTAEFEARPLQPRRVPTLLPESPFTRDRSFSGKVMCNSIYTTRIEQVKQRGKYVRIVEGIPTVARHQTHVGGGIAWRNHGGAVGRVWGIVPVASDGSFSVEVPSDRLFHVQVLDRDRNVVGNELIWQYARPAESKTCVGCHESPDMTPVLGTSFPKAFAQPPVTCLPNDGNFTYRAKVWFKGWLPDEREERMHSVNSLNLIGRQ